MRVYLLCSALLCFTSSAVAQIGADLCNQATVLSLYSVFCGNASDSFTGSNAGAGAEIYYPRLTGCTGDGNLDGPAADVWYRFTPVSHQVTIVVNGLSTPNITVFRGGDCRFLTAVGCASAFPGSGSANLKVNVEPDEIYFLMVSGGDPSDQGTFNLNIISSNDCDACLQEGRFLISRPPLRGTYYPYQEALFRFTVEGWQSGVTIEWPHALEIQHGPGWYQSTLNPLPPEPCAPGSYWDFFSNWVSCNTGEIFGPGFAYESDTGVDCGGAPLDFNPGNNWVQSGGACGLIGPSGQPLEFQWSLWVNPCATNSDDPDPVLNTFLQFLTDSEAGSWINTGCNTTGTFRFPSNNIYNVGCNPAFPDFISI